MIQEKGCIFHARSTNHKWVLTKRRRACKIEKIYIFQLEFTDRRKQICFRKYFRTSDAAARIMK